MLDTKNQMNDSNTVSIEYWMTSITKKVANTEISINNRWWSRAEGDDFRNK